MKKATKTIVTAIAIMQATLSMPVLEVQACHRDSEASQVLVAWEAKSEPQPAPAAILSELRGMARLASLLPVVLPIVKEQLGDGVPAYSAATALREGRRRVERGLIEAVLTSTVAIGARVLGAPFDTGLEAPAHSEAPEGNPEGPDPTCV